MSEFQEAAGQLLVLIMVHSLDGTELSVIIEGLKQSSKSIGTHKRRELYWAAYTALGSRVARLEGQSNCFLKFLTTEDGQGRIEVEEFTKRQRGLVGGGCDFMGKKIKPPEDPTAKGWLMAFSEDDAQLAWDDLHSAEPCVYITNDGVYTATRFKRALCKGLSSMPSSLKDIEKLISELAPDNPLKSISFTANAAPSCNAYNTFLCGPLPAPVVAALPSTVGHVDPKSGNDIYAYFMKRHSQHLLGEAGKLLAQMLVDVQKSLVPLIHASSMKDAGTARKNSLMKKVYVHSSKKAFIDKCREEGGVEMFVIDGDISESEFGRYGGIVFELFYRTELSVFG
jgi:hypothetical protein